MQVSPQTSIFERSNTMICRMIRDGRGCEKFHPIDGCSVYNRGGMKFRTRQGYCPIVDDGPNKKVTVTNAKVRAGQQKQKKK